LIQENSGTVRKVMKLPGSDDEVLAAVHAAGGF
jgi:hypothetical protein